MVAETVPVSSAAIHPEIVRCIGLQSARVSVLIDSRLSGSLSDDHDSHLPVRQIAVSEVYIRLRK